MKKIILTFLLITATLCLQTVKAEDFVSNDLNKTENPSCLSLEYAEDLYKLNVCVKYAEKQYSFALNSDLLMKWVMDTSSFKEAPGIDGCLSTSDELNIIVPCAKLPGATSGEYGFTLKYDKKDQYTWNLDLESVVTPPFLAAGPGDYRTWGWVNAYDEFHAQISKQYAFGEWKGMDWKKLNTEIRPKVVTAEQDNDSTAYAIALREYATSIPDGHVDVSISNLDELVKKNAGGSYGIGIIGLDTGKVIAHIVTGGGEAANAGVEVGDEVIEWNGISITEALSQTSLLWRLEGHSLATEEHRRLESYRMLVLDPVGTQSEIKFLKPDGSVKTLTLKASDDDGTIRDSTGLWNKADMDNIINYKVLNTGYGYVMISALQDKDDSTKNISENFKKVMTSLTEMNVPGIIVDLRGNGGGSDFLAAELAGYFYLETTFYEYQSFYNKLSGEFENILTDDADNIIGRGKALNIEPQFPYYGGPVVALVNPVTISSAEGVAMAIQNLPQGHVAGFYGSNGSFGMTGGQSILPEGISVEFPFGRSLNEDRIIQLDSKNGVGGVIPDIRIPLTAERVIKYAEGEDVELEYVENFLQQR